MKIKVTKEQAIILENLKGPKVIKITEEQYRELLNLEGNAYPSITKAFGKQGSEFKANVSKISRGMVYEDTKNLWEEFINELYGLNESGSNVYERLINMMEKFDYVKDKKLSKEKFNNDKKMAKEIISKGLHEFKNSGSVFMAMESIEKSIENYNNQENKVMDNKEGDIDTIIMDVPLFIRALEYSREDAKNDMALHDIAENAIRLTKEYGTLTMDNYYDIFGDDTQTNSNAEEEPNLTEYDYSEIDVYDEPGYEPKNKIFKIKTNTGESAILEKGGYLYYFDYAYLNIKDFLPYIDRTYTQSYGEKIYNDDKLSNKAIESYVNDIKGIKIGENGLYDYENGDFDIVKIDTPLKELIIDIFPNNTEVKEILNSIDEVTDGSALGGTSLVIPLGSKPEDYIIKKEIKESLTKVVKETAFDKTQWAGGEFVEFDDCTKLNNNKEAQNGGCSTGAIDNVVKLKKTKSNVNAPSLKK